MYHMHRHGFLMRRFTVIYYADLPLQIVFNNYKDLKTTECVLLNEFALETAVNTIVLIVLCATN